MLCTVFDPGSAGWQAFLNESYVILTHLQSVSYCTSFNKSYVILTPNSQVSTPLHGMSKCGYVFQYIVGMYHGALQQKEVKACICPIVKQLWLLPLMHCLYCFCIFINSTAYHLDRYKPSPPSTKELLVCTIFVARAEKIFWQKMIEIFFWNVFNFKL